MEKWKRIADIKEEIIKDYPEPIKQGIRQDLKIIEEELIGTESCVIILKNNEEFQKINAEYNLAEREAEANEIIGWNKKMWRKLLYILSDYGEGIILIGELEVFNGIKI